MGRSLFEKMPMWIIITSYRHSISGAWGQQCYLGNNIRNVFRCILSCSICVQNFIEFELIITELCLVMYLLNRLTQLVMSQCLLNQQFIFCTFLQTTLQLKESITVNSQSVYFFTLFHMKQ